MFKWLNQRFGKGKQKAGKLPQGELKGDLPVKDKASQQDSSDSLSPLLKTAIADAEEIVASIKMRIVLASASR